MKAEIIARLSSLGIFMETKKPIIKGMIGISMKTAPISNVTKIAPCQVKRLTIYAKIQHQWSEKKPQPIKSASFTVETFILPNSLRRK